MAVKLLDKLGIKLILAVGVTIVLSIGALSFLTVRFLRTALEEEVERHANQLSETVKHGTRYDMLLNQPDRIHEVIANMARQPTISRIRVLNKSGEVMYSSKSGDVGQMVDKAAEACYGCHAANQPLERLSIEARTRIFETENGDGRILGIINPIYNEPSCYESSCHEHDRSQTVLGVLDVTMSLADVDEAIQRIEMNIIVLASIAIVLVSVVIGWFVKSWVDRPVKSLLNATREVASGNLNHVIPVERADELGQLARSFNNMTSKLAEARLQLFQSDKMASLGRLAAGVAHEINNPLTGVLTYATYLLKRCGSQPELQNDLKVIVRETLRSREIVKSLLDFARQSVPKRSPADIHEIIDHALAVVDNQLTMNRVRVVKEFGEQIPPIQVDTNQMQQVMINLIVNANDAINSHGGTITISTALKSLSPVGMLVVKKAECPKRHTLLDQEVRFGGRPSIKVKVRRRAEEGYMYFDAVYGSHERKITLRAPNEKADDVVCPQCGVSMMERSIQCPSCGSGVFAFVVPGRGLFHRCARPECGWQKWDAAEEEGVREYVEIGVHDTGCGIPREQLEHIFEPFFTTKGQKGTGLGLAVIWGIVDNHNGKISVESESGRGTTFRIQLPVESGR
jgi:two-component system NtrC family sensor kinase